MHSHIELNPIRIITQRLELRDIQTQDIEAISRFLNDARVQQYTLTDNPAFIRQQIMHAIQSVNDSPRYCFSFSVLLKESKNLIGQLDINLSQDDFIAAIGWELNPQYWDGNQFIPPQENAVEFLDDSVAQLGWDFDPAYWNCGYATEAVQGAIQYAFLHLDISAILAHCFFDNTASRRVMEKNGMQQQKLTLWQQGQLQDFYQEARTILSYGLRRSSWKEKQKQR